MVGPLESACLKSLQMDFGVFDQKAAVISAEGRGAKKRQILPAEMRESAPRLKRRNQRDDDRNEVLDGVWNKFGGCLFTDSEDQRDAFEDKVLPR